MRKYTVADIVELDSCYEIQEIEQLWDGREELSLAEICRLNIGLMDIIWVASELLPKRAIRLYACDCAEHVLQLFEREHPADARPRECIDMARKYADGNASEEELDACWDAAREAACDAGWTAADAAACITACAAARAAASAAADAAAYDAANAAAWAVSCYVASTAARRTEQKWQLNRLIEYVAEAEKNPMKGHEHA